jgi:hypothetical protein
MLFGKVLDPRAIRKEETYPSGIALVRQTCAVVISPKLCTHQHQFDKWIFCLTPARLAEDQEIG